MALHEAIATASDPATVMDRVLAEALVLVPRADGAVIELCTTGDTLIHAAGAGSLTDTRGTEVALAGSLSGLAIKSGAIQHCVDTTRDPRVDRGTCGALGIASMICVPLQRGNEHVGVLKVASGHVSAFGSQDETSLTRLAPFVSTVIGAAVELASVTGELLGGERDPTDDASDHGHLDGVGATARARATFVANIVSPGTALDSAVSDRIDAVLGGGGLTLAFQPIVALRDGSITEVEALSRFTGPPLQGPDRWFAEAARVGRGQALELHAIDLALRSLDLVPSPVALAINAGPDTFCSTELLDLLEATASWRVVVELTEHVGIEDYPARRRARRALRSLGVKVAIDDTGSGFAGLSLILEVAPEIIKLDRELTGGIDSDPVRRALASALVTFGRDTGAEVVAEGIETAAELSMLTDLGIAYGQGFYLARPSSLEDLGPLLDRRRLAFSANFSA
jgi:EAL domain-containing protein (putative c-di-GMP-specific phosphodiesterase class I)